MRSIPLVILFFISILSAHTLKPAYLEIDAKSNGSYAIKWKIPLINKERVEIRPHFPKGCQEVSGSQYLLDDENLKIIYFTLTCRDSLVGKEITIDGLDENLMDVLIQFKKGNQLSYVKRLTSSTNHFVVQSYPSIFNTIESYLPLGVKHILIGFDHLLFVLGLILIISRFRMLLLTISSFTLAHSITLGLTIMGVVYPSSRFIEALIALSIVMLAVEIIYSHYGKYGLFSRYPWGIAFLFGLIHGFGFASVLLELGIPKGYLITALISFNIGIELGQLLFIFVLFGFYLFFKKILSKEYLFFGKVMLTYFIGVTAVYWLIERVYF